MKVRSLFFLFLLFALKPLQAQTPSVKVLEQLLAMPAYQHAQIGLLVSDLKTGQVLHELNSAKLLVPASVLKLVTSAAALEILGPDYQFHTRLGYTGTIENHVLTGDLVVIGGGDPALGSEYFYNHYFSPDFLKEWIKKIKAAGIYEVKGRLIIDNSLYSSERIPPTWIWEDMGNYYGTVTSALTVYDNLTKIHFQSPPVAGQPVRLLSVNPELRGISWHNEVLSSNVPRDRAYVFGSPFSNQRIIRGTIPKNRRLFTIKASNPFPENLLAEELYSHLVASGIHVAGSRAVEKIDPLDFRLLTALESPALSEIVNTLNKESVNLFAEHLVRQIAAEYSGIGDREAGLKMIADFWESKGLDVSQLFMEDGSGLSHFNAVTPHFISSVLSFMKNSSSNATVFFESLPEAGQGTLSRFDPSLFPPQGFRLKSGSMKRIQCFAGYIHTDSGRDYVVSLFVNHFAGSHTRLVAELQKWFLALKKE